MKKVCLILAAVLLMTMTQAAFADSSDGKFEEKDSLNVVYLGGSITQGAGINMSDGEKCWVQLVSDYFTSKYPKTKVNNYNVGVGGTPSEFGLARLEADVMSKKPDVVFVEFAVNDQYGGTAETNHKNVIANMEGIVRNLMSMDSVPYIIFVYTTQYYNNTMYYDCSEWHQEVADNYGIPSIDLQPVVEKYLSDHTGSSITDVLGDNVHPNALGYKLYAEEIIAKLETGDYYKKPKKEAEWLTQETEKRYDYIMRSVKLTDKNFDESFADGSNGAYIGLSLGTVGKVSNVPGSEMALDFYGNAVGIQTRIGSDCGFARVEIDGETVAKLSSYVNTSGKTSPRLTYLNRNLSDGMHHLRIVVLPDKDKNTDTKIWIDRIFVADGVCDYTSGLAVSAKLLNLQAEALGSVTASEMNIIELTVKNENDEDVSEEILCAVYGSDNKLKGISRLPVEIEADSYKKFGIGQRIAVEGNWIKLMQWDSLNGLKPIYKGMLFK